MVNQEPVGEDGKCLEATPLCLIQVISAKSLITIDPQMTDQKPKIFHSPSLCSHIFDDQRLTDEHHHAPRHVASDHVIW